ncbi:MAG: hypothetical protein NT180_01085 [Actinobacteria bacterium]|nr:hypothetical protein [Actinomycetota bacterium]
MGRVWVEFTQSSRKHRIGRERMRHVLANPVVFETVESDDGSRVELLFLGPDETGRVLEVVAIREEERLVVIHAMDMRSKYRSRYEGGISSE